MPISIVEVRGGYRARRPYKPRGKAISRGGSRIAAPKPKKRPKKKNLKKLLDAVFSKFIRARDKNICYTCGIQMEPNKSQNGHFVPRQYLSLRYDEINCHCQCYACNILYNGQPSAYAIRLKRDFGEDIVEKLENRRKELTKLKPEWYEEKITHYQKLLSV